MAKTITGKFENPNGSAVANGILKLRLSQPANISGTAQIVAAEVTIQLDATGSIPGGTTILANDELTPAGTTYYASLFNGVLGSDGVTYKAGGQIWAQQWSISGNSPIDLTTLTATTSNVSLPSPITSIGLTMPAEFSVAGSPLTQNGALAVTKANESANQVFAGPTSGGAAAPAFRALVNNDIPATLTGKTLNGPSSGNSIALLSAQSVTSAKVGTGAMQSIFTPVTIPANSFRAGTVLRAKFAVFHSTGTAAVAYQWLIDSTGVNVWDIASTAQVVGTGELIIVFVAGTSQNATSSAFFGPTVVGGLNAAAVTWDVTLSHTLNLQFNVANTDQVTGEWLTVELVQ